MIANTFMLRIEVNGEPDRLEIRPMLLRIVALIRVLESDIPGHSRA
jgi:hypothetical protein